MSTTMFACGGHHRLESLSFQRFWAIAARVNSSWTPYGPRNRSLAKDAFEVYERHLDFLSSIRSNLIEV
jgi:hypothetical protein